MGIKDNLSVSDEAKPKPKASVSGFDFDSLKVPVDLSVAAVEKTIAGIPLVKKFPKGQFCQTKMDASFSLNCYWGTSGNDIDEKVLVVPDEVIPYLPNNIETTLTTFIPIISREGNIQSLYVKHPAPGRTQNEWNISKIAACNAADGKWFRMASGQDRYSYDHGAGINQEPGWPKDFDSKKHFELAVEKFVVEGGDDPHLRALRGDE